MSTADARVDVEYQTGGDWHYGHTLELAVDDLPETTNRVQSEADRLLQTTAPEVTGVRLVAHLSGITSGDEHPVETLSIEARR